MGGDQASFVRMMNEKAKSLGCTSSNFTNAHGLSDDAQYSTARDLAIITKAALGNERFRQMFGLTNYTVEATNKSDVRNLKTTNNMMREDLRNFAGRRYSGQRNHIKKFYEACPAAEFRALTAEDLRVSKISVFFS